MPDRKRQFVPTDFDPADFTQIEPMYQQLLDRELGTSDDVVAWLDDYSELSAVLGEYAAITRIDHACHTEDEAIEKKFMHWVEQIAPKIRPIEFALQRKFVECRHTSDLQGERFDMLRRDWKAQVELFRESNIPLQTESTKLTSQYDKIIGGMMVEYQGKTLTLQQLARYQEDTDRQVRETTWRLTNERRYEDHEPLTDVFEKLLTIRQQMATNADHPDFRSYTWANFHRFDYTPDDCLAMHDAIEAVCVPMIARLNEQRREQMGLDALRPWDIAVDPLGREPLSPFAADDVAKLVGDSKTVFERVWPPLADEFGKLKQGRNLDLQSRKGKRAGGFQSSLVESGEPFIFMNAAGLQRDVETMLHEAGHAFHFVWAFENEPWMFLQHAPLEFCEVASMSMELIGQDHFDVYYDQAELADRARRRLLEGIVRVFPWISIIDSYQHWLYTNPGHSAEQRTQAWRDLLDRFYEPGVDWTGLEQYREVAWQKQLHLYHVPFYYIEYGIAQLGALQLWQRYRDDRDAALTAYREALSLGGTRPLPALFEAAGLKFDFSRKVFEPVMTSLFDELMALPA